MSIYFTRHGQIGIGDTLSQRGQDELARIKTKLDRLGFTPKICLSSKAQRCIETSEILAPNIKCVKIDELFVFAPFRTLKMSARNIMTAILPFIIRHQHVLVVSHDSVAVALAMRLQEIDKKVVDWDTVPRHLISLEQGHGLYVDDNGNMTYMNP